ncbi:UDP-N-acetylmuramoyl-tripeptide--D-alanyl-D-alanine ligase [Saxibacter everestensis]|uniref:UDP-N-acetylmuramoyl-tripeptide--D-alanyl-D-alanine ligase n=1 Tax=Saxibacter everestensis TaxID=2909229 RepID=A0ABY8QWJ6_9MICO|nr:UDP-N-acetylmuramoyl-tripeptide--D-alanyl-D-alanine ligase [Brevibacteriaceae bacterium ZFBP1038]
MKEFSYKQIAAAVGGEIVGADPELRTAGPVVTDSRDVSPGAVYVARRGESLDGLDFAASAVQEGAALVIGEEVVHVDGVPLPSIVVEDATVALGLLAHANVTALRAKAPTGSDAGQPAGAAAVDHGGLKVVAITGSAGKTTTKDLLADFLVSLGQTVWPPNSFNNEVGVPLTALRADEDTRFLVLEMGAREPGNLSYLTSLVRPDIAVELNVGSAHSGIFGSVEATAKAKAELVQSLDSDGIAVLNLDDDRVANMASKVADGVGIVWFSLSGRQHSTQPTVWAEDVTSDATGRTSFLLCLPDGQTAQIQLALLGEHHVANALAAAAAAWRMGVSLTTISTVLATSGAASRWRMELVDSPSGVTVLNDAYNANPDSMRSALKTLATMGRGDAQNPPRRTWAVLGEMLELGESSVEEHDSIGRLVVRLNISRLLAVGEGARPIYQAANLEGSWGEEAAWVPDVAAARAFLNESLSPGDLVLFKSSRDAGLRYLGDDVAGVTQ